MAQQAVSILKILLRSPSHYGWDPFPFHLFADVFSFLKEPDITQLKDVSENTFSTTTTKRRGGGDDKVKQNLSSGVFRRIRHGRVFLKMEVK